MVGDTYSTSPICGRLPFDGSRPPRPFAPRPTQAMRGVAHAACSLCGSPNPTSASTLGARSGRADCIGRPCASSARRPPAGEYVSVESLGRSSLMGGGSLLPPGAFRLLPFRRKALLPISLAPAAHARPIALTLIPPGFVLPLVALAPPRFSSARASLIPRFPALAGLRCASPLRKRLPAPLWASLRSAHATQARVRGI